MALRFPQGYFFDPSPTANLVGVEEGRSGIWSVLFCCHHDAVDSRCPT